MIKINTAGGERTLVPADDAARAALTPLPDDPEGRVLVKLEIPELTSSDEWEETTDLITGRAIKVRRADCGAGCRCAAEVKLVGVEGATARLDLEFLWNEVQLAADVMLGINNGGTWGSFTCTEIEALADIFRAAGRGDVADFIIAEHGESDEDDDMHTKEEPDA